MDLEAALRAAAPRASQEAVDALLAVKDKLTQIGALANPQRAASLFGQCTHESGQFTIKAENLNYTTPARLFEIFKKYFDNEAHAAQFTRNPEKLANRVYANRIGNGPESSGDGFRYRGQGYLQLTGRENYRDFGNKLGIDLEGNPALAQEPETAWLIAGQFLASRRRNGKTALEWADLGDWRKVTLIVNGGTHGLDDRIEATERAIRALGGELPAPSMAPTLREKDSGDAVRRLQQALTDRNFSTKGVDGKFGANTTAAVKAFQRSVGLDDDGIVGSQTWDALT